MRVLIQRTFHTLLCHLDWGRSSSAQQENWSILTFLRTLDLHRLYGSSCVDETREQLRPGKISNDLLQAQIKQHSPADLAALRIPLILQEAWRV